ncbi:MAG: hypothetical protein KGO53_01005 [Alphaproteobacteria bacterium]|nr:hypothetical protein [Alphaproteobacteria bacterium]
MRGPDYPRRQERRRSLTLAIVGLAFLLSAMTLLAFAAGLFVGHPELTTRYFGFPSPSSQPPSQPVAEPPKPAAAGLATEKSDLDLASGGSTEVEVLPPPPVQPPAQPAVKPQPAALPDDAVAQDDATIDPSGIASSGDSAGLGPLLRRTGAGPADYDISRFTTIQMTGGMKECIGIGQSLLATVGAPKEQFEILVSQSFMTMGRICAANGSILVSCRSNRISISPRRRRPDDGCEASRKATP